ncbi:MAG: hypothetical protein AAF629_29215 [Chloroflexota bacterium]
MTTYKRPWWAIARQLPAFKATLQEDHQVTIKRHIVAGEPIILSFAWITYGPLFAVIGVAILTVVAWYIDISDQAMSNRIIFACSMLAFPAILWVVGGFVSSRFIQRFLDREIQSKVEHTTITLDIEKQTLTVDQLSPIDFAEIRAFKLVSDSGFAYEPDEDSNPLVHLVMETSQGQVTILEKYLSTAQQKLQLISKLEAHVMPKDTTQS